MRLGSTSLSVTKPGRKRKRASGGGLAPGNPVNVTYAYHAYGAGVNVAYIYWVTSNGYNLLRTITGQQHTGHNIAWSTYTDDLTPYRGTTGKVAWVYYTNSQTTSSEVLNYTQDVAFDDMKINNYDQANSIQDLSPTSTNTHLGQISNQNSLPSATSVISTVNTYNTALASRPNAIKRDPTVAENRRYWNVVQGSTPSSNTGPDNAANNSNNTYYIMYEASSGDSTTNNRYEVLTMSNTITLA